MGPGNEHRPDESNDTAHDRQAEAGRVAEARSILAAIDATVFADRGKATRIGHRRRFIATVAGLFGDG